MNDFTFKEGQEVNALYWPDDSKLVAGQNNVEKITVVMEYGQMAGVPWFAAWSNGKIIGKHNAALIASVAL